MTGDGLEPTFGINEMSRAVPDRGVGATTSGGRTLCQPNTFAASMARNVAKAPARGGGRALRGGACGTLILRVGSRRQRQLQAKTYPQFRQKAGTSSTITAKTSNRPISIARIISALAASGNAATDPVAPTVSPNAGPTLKIAVHAAVTDSINGRPVISSATEKKPSDRM